MVCSEAKHGFEPCVSSALRLAFGHRQEDVQSICGILIGQRMLDAK